MRTQRWAVAAFVLLAAAAPSRAREVWDNGPPQGESGIFLSDQTISNSFAVSSPMPVTIAQVALWIHMGDVPTFVDWSVGTGPFGDNLGSREAAPLFKRVCVQ
jgi:hypothetical protein